MTNRQVSRLIVDDLIAEGITAVFLVALPVLMLRSILGSPILGLDATIGHHFGLGLGLFVAGCWIGLRRGARNPVLIALFAYNLLAAVQLAGIGLAGGSGILQ